MFNRFRATLELAVTQLRYHRRRTLLAIVGVTLSVVLLVTLVGLGYGLLSTGGEAITWINRDLWATGGVVGLAPGTVGGVENPIQNAHPVARDIEADERVIAAEPIAFKSVYVSPNTSRFSSVVGVGVGRSYQAEQGAGFSIPDTHYANGSYEGPMVHEIEISPKLATRYDVGVNDTLYIGGTLATARKHEFRIVSVTREFSTFLGAPTVVMPLSELQEVTHTTGTDPATFIAITVKPTADPTSVAPRIERRHSSLTVRTNSEQVRAIVGDQAGLVAAALALMILAVVTGIALVVNVLSMWVYHQRRELAALKAAGISRRSLVGLVLAEGTLVGALGGVLGLVVTPGIVVAVNRVAADVSGFSNLIKTPLWLLAGGFTLAVLIGILGAGVAGWRVARLSPLTHLEEG